MYFYAQQKVWDKAASLLDSMRSRSIAIDPFVERELVVDIYTKAGRPQDIPGGAAKPAAEDAGVEEDIQSA